MRLRTVLALLGIALLCAACNSLRDVCPTTCAWLAKERAAQVARGYGPNGAR